MILCPVCRSPQIRCEVRDDPIWLCPCSRLFYRESPFGPDSGLCGWAFFAERRRGSNFIVPVRPVDDGPDRIVENILRDWTEHALAEWVLES